MNLTYTSSMELQKRSGITLQEISTGLTTVLYIYQALSSTNAIQIWQACYSIITLISALIGFWFYHKFKVVHLLLLPIIVSFMAPILIGNHATSPWMSIGLTTVLLNAGFAALYETRISIPLIGLTTLIHVLISRHQFPSISDLADTNSFGSYYAIIWNAGLAFALVYAKHRYQRTCNLIDEEIESQYINLLSTLKRFTKINRQDWKNVQLHGTLLNTLISIRNLIKFEQVYSSAVSQLENEVKNLLSASSTDRNFLQELESLSRQPEFARLHFEIDGVHDFTNKEEKARYVELCREIFLNTTKHTDASKIKVEFKIIKLNDIEIKIHTFENNSKVQLARNSKTLDRLQDLLDITFEIQEWKNGLLYLIKSNFESDKGLELKDIEQFRNTGLAAVGNDLLKGATLISLLTALGLSLTGGLGKTFVYASLQTSLLILLSFNLISNEKLISLASTLVVLIFPLYFVNIESCSQTEHIPWVFDISLAACFLALLKVEGKLVRWIPLILFTADSIYLPNLLPVNCRQLLLGSVPALLLIPILVYGLHIFRKFAIKTDADNLLGIYNNQTELEQISEDLEKEFQAILEFTSSEIKNLDSGLLSSDQTIHRFEVLIQLIRLYLLTSEQYESEMIRKLYFFGKQRLLAGDSTRVEIEGNNFDLGKFNSEFDDLLEIIRIQTHGRDIEIILSNIPSYFLKLHLVEENFEITQKLKESVASLSQIEFILE